MRMRSRKGMLRERCMQFLFGWSCPSRWNRFASVLELFIMDAFVDLFITLCIIVNTVFMAMDHAGMTDELTRALAIGNYVRRLSPSSYSLSIDHIVGRGGSLADSTPFVIRVKGSNSALAAT